MKVKLTGCPGCQEPIKAYDTHRAEVVCEHCGLVITTNTDFKEIPFTKEEKLGSKIVLNDTSYNPHFLKAHNHIKWVPNTPKKDWRIQQYYNHLMVLKSRFMATETQTDSVMYLIKKHGLKFFYEKGIDHEVTLLHMLIVMMKFDQGRKITGQIKELRLQGEFNKHVYSVVCEKIKSVYDWE